AGVDGNPSNLGMQTDYKNFAPRLGAAYRATENTVIRAGIGVSYLPFVDNSYAYNYPIKTSTNYTNSPTYGPTLSSAGGGVVNLVTGIPATPTAAFASNGTLVESAANGTIALGNLYIPLNFKNAYVTSWNLVVQQALPADMSLQIGYVANHGTDIDVAQNINQPLVYGQGGSTYDPLNVAFGKTASVTQYFLGNSSNYQSLQAQLTRRFSHGVGFTSVFTWGKAEGYQTGTLDGNLLFWAGPVRRNYSVLDFDRTRNFEQQVTYELPAGRGHRYFNSGIAQYVLGGWRTSATITAVSGLPFTITATSKTGGTTQTANQVGVYKVLHNVSGGASTTHPEWFDPGPTGTGPNGANFQDPNVASPCVAYSSTNQTPCTFGNTGRNQFRGPGYFNDNLSLFKSFPIFRESQLTARFDAFNATNTPDFSNPQASITSATFGQITSTLGSGQGNVNGVGGPRVLQASVKITF
ncbi:MAG TPA: TonB-dependent receptor, partial [Acidobacteriaceae bacterium]|nr:TonB-dependent receptor [Acidobacteriaceae bacterium]